MSFEFPANVERDIERYAQAEHISPTEGPSNWFSTRSGSRSAKPAAVNSPTRSGRAYGKPIRALRSLPRCRNP